ncbi:hypothetical protein PGT21_027955 [Puccinia graminis f. sp. tritici]|uniref:Rhodanese domain-containing protein n=1 Tax=Puccinia graminis f. sp. tritici TaxID=56615 RepID=A0A5B0M7W2_PUCGR|nr:hypothetical protein PGT21_027955 [Puccinia graminis f. sp. tritici]
MGLYSFAPPRVIANRIKAGRLNKDWAVVDVRDSDFIGGHIPGCHHIPSENFHERCKALIDELKDVKCVIFHCALSRESDSGSSKVTTGSKSALRDAHDETIAEQRGPTAAKLYAHRREDNLVSGSLKSLLPFGTEAQARGEAQEVMIVQGGFKEWAEEFKDDPALVEGYNPALW